MQSTGFLEMKMNLFFLILLLSAPLQAKEKKFSINCSIKVTNLETGRSYVRRSLDHAAPATDRKKSWLECIDDLINENNFTKEELSVEKGETKEPVTTKHKQNPFQEAADEAARKTDEKYGIKLK